MTVAVDPLELEGASIPKGGRVALELPAQFDGEVTR